MVAGAFWPSRATLAVSVFALVERDLRLLALAVPGLLTLLALLPSERLPSERKLARFVAGAGAAAGSTIPR